MSNISYSTNFMGPITTGWFKERGLTDEDGEITTYYSGGRIDIRDYRCEGYDGWNEYALPIMHGEDWNALSDWLDDFTSEELIPYDELIAMFEEQYGKKIRWADQVFAMASAWMQ